MEWIVHISQENIQKMFLDSPGQPFSPFVGICYASDKFVSLRLVIYESEYIIHILGHQ